MSTVLLDYGMGNLRSVENACQKLGFRVSIQSTLAGAEKLIIPGVGAFGAAMSRLAPLADQIKSFAASGQPLMGICLGQQLLFESSEEMGEHAGLGLLGGRVRYLPAEAGLKIPHIGWSPLKLSGSAITDSLHDGDQVYFVHSLYCDVADDSDVAATAEYAVTIPAAVQKGNLWGTQFHPEKSGDVGLRILRNFLLC